MKSLAVWSLILIPSVILAVYIGQSMDSDTAALATGAIIGIMGAALAALITALVRDERHTRQIAEARRPHPSPQAPDPTYIDATWRELPSTPHAPPPTPQVEAPTRALTRRS